MEKQFQVVGKGSATGLVNDGASSVQTGIKVYTRILLQYLSIPANYSNKKWQQLPASVITVSYIFDSFCDCINSSLSQEREREVSLQ